MQARPPAEPVHAAGSAFTSSSTRFDGQYVFHVSPVDSGGRMSSIARSLFPRMSLRRFCFRACV